MHQEQHQLIGRSLSSILRCIVYGCKKSVEVAMAYKVLIIDDERKTREGLAKFVDWKSMGYEVAAKFADGGEAMEYIEKNPVDVILSDIKMTFMSGLELAKYVYENQSHIKVVLISGFKEFDYAKQAIQYNVVNYILKPASTEDIQNVFRALKLQMDKELRTKQQELTNKEQFEEIVSLLKEEFFTDLFLGALRNKNEINRKVKLLNSDFDSANSPCATITVRIDNYENFVKNNWNYGRDSLYTAIRNFFQAGNTDILYFPVGNVNESVKFVAVNKSQREKEEFIVDLVNDLDSVKTEVRGFLGLDILATIEKYFDNIFELAKDTSPMEEHAQNPPANGKRPEKDKDLKMEEQIKLMVTHLSTGNYKMSISIFDLFIEEVESLDIREIHKFIIYLFATLYSKLAEIGINATAFNREGFYYEDVLNIDNVEDIRLWGENKLKEVIDQINVSTGNSDFNSIDKAKQYIIENYNKDITLKDIADHIYLNSAYFSRLFKEKTGENFSDYLIKIRMQKAAELLKDSRYKVHEVSHMIGYESLRYFYRLFKRHNGLTPTEYRRTIWGNDNEMD